MREKLVAAAAPLFPDLSVVRTQCRLDEDETDLDSLLTLFVSAAVATAEHEMNRPILPQSWCRTFDDVGVALLSLRSDVVAVSSVVARDAAGVETPLPVHAWRLARGKDLILFDGWPAGAVEIDVSFSCGAWTVDTVPDAIKHWVLIRVATALRNAEEVIQGASAVAMLPRSHVDGLLDTWRRYA